VRKRTAPPENASTTISEENRAADGGANVLLMIEPSQSLSQITLFRTFTTIVWFDWQSTRYENAVKRNPTINNAWIPAVCGGTCYVQEISDHRGVARHTTKQLVRLAVFRSKRDADVYGGHSAISNRR
jgi:hypothetical protein